MSKGQVKFIAWRFYLILSVIFVIVSFLIYRVFDLSILDQHFLRQQGNERVLRLVSTPAFRGMIVDRNGFPLAVSTTVYSAWINPQEFVPTKTELNSLAKLVHVKPKEIMLIDERLKKSKREFAYLKRGLAPDVARQIKHLNIEGVYLQQAYHRYYPEGEVTSQLIGFTNVDDKGQEGMELGYNDWLQGEPGKKWVIKDRLGRIISDVQVVQKEKAGHDLVMSIDRRIQYLAYRELLSGVVANQAHSGSAIVLDAKTGEVLAMVNQPSFNPNNHSSASKDSFRNRAITDTFEPGSTAKAFSVASAIDSGKFNADTVVDTFPGWMRVGHHVVRDEHNNGPLTVTQILQKSSNIGVTKMLLELPPNQLWNVLHNVGFGEITGIGFPGEQSGSLENHYPWDPFVLATFGFGYGFSTTALQLTRAYSILANEGLKKPLSLLKLDNPPATERVIAKQTAKEMMDLLESVLAKGGTGTKAGIPGYRVGGKTGTVRMRGPHGYLKDNHLSLFVGIAPLSNPRFVVAVVIQDPKGKKFLGGDVAGPVFAHIMEGTLRMLNVPPDAA